MPRLQKIILAIAVLAAFGGGVALYYYHEKRNAEPVAPEDAEAIVEQTEINSQLMQNDLNEQLDDRRADEQARLDSPLGQALFAKCLEWQEFAANHPSEQAEKNRDSACGDYDDFLQSGEVISSPGDP